MKDSTKRRGFIGKALVLMGALFASGTADKMAFAKQGRRGGATHAQGAGWGGSAVFSPKRTKFKPSYMRDPQWRAKRNK